MSRNPSRDSKHRRILLWECQTSVKKQGLSNWRSLTGPWYIHPDRIRLKPVFVCKEALEWRLSRHALIRHRCIVLMAKCHSRARYALSRAFDASLAFGFVLVALQLALPTRKTATTVNSERRQGESQRSPSSPRSHSGRSETAVTSCVIDGASMGHGAGSSS